MSTFSSKLRLLLSLAVVFAAFAVVAGDLADAEAEGDVLGDGHVGPEGVGLEDHAGVAFVGGGVGDVFEVKR